MCGIAGYYGLEPNHGLLQRMGEAQRHRGPDGEGFFIEGAVGLAHQRLAIIDLPGGQQPMTTPDGRYTLAYNGEVYNYRALRSELEATTRTFTTDSDTEVVLQAFAEWGEAAFDRFNGMFALTIWDHETETLTLARDHFGIKPLYLCAVPPSASAAGPGWLFASEIKAILASGLFTPTPNERTVFRYLRYRVHDDTSETFFDGIERLMPGQTVTLSASGITRRSFTTLREDLEGHHGPDHPHAGPGADPGAGLATEFGERLTEAVALRLQSDVPVGTSLSGGLDSSAITVTIDRLLDTDDPSTGAVGERQSTFSAVFPGYRNDEESYVDDAVAACTRPVRSHKTVPTSAAFLGDITDFVRTQEEPVISTGPYAQYRVMQDASEHVKVMLDGQGADEMLAGYVPQLMVHLRQLRQVAPRDAATELFASRDILKHLVRNRINPTRSLTRDRGSVTDLLRPTFTAKHDHERYAPPATNLRARLVHDLYVGSIPALLRYEDRNSMRFSVEGRVPFLDPDLVRTVFAMPDAAIIKRGWNKRVLREAVAGVLPDSITWRRNKIGFTTPQNEWFHEQREFIYRVFLSPSFALRPYFDRNEVLTAFEKWLSGSGDLDSMVFWRLLNLELWLREFIDPHRPGPAQHEAHDGDADAHDRTFDGMDDVERGFAAPGRSNAGKQLDLTLTDGSVVRRYPVRTRGLVATDDLVLSAVSAVEGFLDRQPSGENTMTGRTWYLFVAEKIVAITQDRSFFVWDIPVTRAARHLSRHVTRTPAGIGLGSPFTMQLAIDHAGLPRVLVAAAAGVIGRAVGRRGVFYTAVGGDVRAIDGPTEYSVYPANLSAKLPPSNPAQVAAALSAAIRDTLPDPWRSSFGGTVIIDANDLGCNVLGTDATGPVPRYAAMFADNPLGQGTERTPLAVVVDDAAPPSTRRDHASLAHA